MLTTVAAGRVYDFSHCMGMYSTSGIGFLVPMDFALGSNNTMYVLNRGVDEITLRISKCTLDHKFIARHWSLWHGRRPVRLAHGDCAG